MLGSLRNLFARFPSRLSSAYLKRRLVSALIVFIVVYVLNFLIPHLEPGSFISGMAGQSNLLPEQRKQLMDMFGVNKPLSQQFIDYFFQTFGSFPPNYGVSFSKYPLSVWTVVSQALPWTLFLVIGSQLIAWTFGTLSGALLAWKRGSKADSFLLGISSFMWGVPSYWLATILIYVLAVKLRLFPPALTGSGVVSGDPFLQMTTILSHAFLPILTLVILNLPVYAVVMRNTMVNVLQEDFMMAASVRGLRTRNLIFGHAMRNALLPSVTNLALSFGAVLSGAYLVEIIYSYPGMGYLIQQAVFARDYPLLQGVFFFSAILVILANILADLAYVFLDPRVEYY